jgi:hypothetical protein
VALFGEDRSAWFAADAIAVTPGEDERRQIDLRLASPPSAER